MTVMVQSLILNTLVTHLLAVAVGVAIVVVAIAAVIAVGDLVQSCCPSCS